MNVVFSVRVFIASTISICFIVIPRILAYFQLELDAIEMIISPWATFILILLAGGILLFPWIRRPKIGVFLLVLLVLVAVGLTFYFCNMTLPW